MLDAATLALVLACGNGADPRLVDAIAQHESHWRAEAVSPRNRNGTRDYGALQINGAELSRWGLTPQTALDPCRSVDAGTRHLIASSGPDAVKPAAVDALLRAIQAYNPGDPEYKAKILELLAKHSRSDSGGKPTQTTVGEPTMLEDAPDSGEIQFPSKGS